jgi:WD40 repeat protein
MHKDGVLDAAFSPGGRKVATGGEDGFVMVWDALTGKPIFSRQQPQKVDHVRFSSDGRFLLVSCRNSSLRVIHVATGELVTDIPYGSSNAVADFSPGNDGIVFAGFDGNPVIVPLESSALSIDRLQKTAELLSNHKLTPFGFERLTLDEISDTWRSLETGK